MVCTVCCSGMLDTGASHDSFCAISEAIRRLHAVVNPLREAAMACDPTAEAGLGHRLAPSGQTHLCSRQLASLGLFSTTPRPLAWTAPTPPWQPTSPITVCTWPLSGAKTSATRVSCGGSPSKTRSEHVDPLANGLRADATLPAIWAVHARRLPPVLLEVSGEAGTLVLRLVRVIICVFVFSLALILACVLEGFTHVIRLVTKPVVISRSMSTCGCVVVRVPPVAQRQQKGQMGRCASCGLRFRLSVLLPQR